MGQLSFQGFADTIAKEIYNALGGACDVRIAQLSEVAPYPGKSEVVGIVVQEEGKEPMFEKLSKAYLDCARGFDGNVEEYARYFAESTKNFYRDAYER